MYTVDLSTNWLNLATDNENGRKAFNFFFNRKPKISQQLRFDLHKPVLIQMDAAVPLSRLVVVPLQAAAATAEAGDQPEPAVNKDDDLLSERFVKLLEEPALPDAPDDTASLRTFVFDDGFKIDVISRRERKKKEVAEEEEEGEETEQEGDNASTVVLEEEDGTDSQADSELDALVQEIDAREAAATAAAAVPKLEAIAEEVHVNEDAEEHYDGAAGLWGQDYKLPCFKGAIPKNRPQFQTVHYQTSSQTNVNPFAVSQTAIPFVDRSCKPASTMQQIVRAAEEAVVFTKVPADCQFCNRLIDVGRGVVLKGCNCTFCRHCIILAIENSDTAVMACPSKQVRCSGEVRDEEIKALLSPDAYDKYTTEMLYKMNVVEVTELVEEFEFVENKNEFQCDICMDNCKPGEGIVLKSCLHQYCRNCIGKYIEGAGEAEIPCPWRDDDGLRCIGMISEMEIRSLIPLDSYRRYLDISLASAEAATPNAYHCKTPNCRYWVEIDADVENFQCGVCLRQNCVKCKAVHQGISCQDYYDMAHGDDRRARENAATENQVRGLLQAKRAQNCPKCGILVQRFDGCRHMTCTKCKHEFDWTGVDLHDI